MALSAGEVEAVLKMRDSMSEVVEGVRGVLDKLGLSGSEVSKALGAGFEGAAIGVGVFAAAAVAAVAVVGGVTAAVVALAERGSEVEDIHDNFDTLTASAGGSSAAIEALRSGTQGLISDFDLMKSTNKALTAGWQASTKDLHDMGEAALILSKQVGVPMKQAFDDVTEAMTTGMVRGLTRDLGLFIEVKGASTDLKSQLSQLNEEMTTGADRDAKRAATMEALQAVIAKSGKPVLDFADNLQRARVDAENFFDNLSEAVAKSPVIKTAMESLESAVAHIFGDDQQSQVKTISGLIDRMFIAIAEGGAAAIRIYGSMGEGLLQLQKVLLGVETDVLSVMQTYLQLSGLAQSIGSFGLIGQKTRDDIKALTGSEGLTDALARVKVGLKNNDDALFKNGLETQIFGLYVEGATGLAREFVDKLKSAKPAIDEHGKALHAAAGNVDEMSASDKDWLSKQASFLQGVDELGRKISNVATDSTLSWEDMTRMFGADALKIIAGAREMGVPLEKIPDQILALGNAMKKLTISDAMDKATASAVAQETAFAKLANSGPQIDNYFKIIEADLDKQQQLWGIWGQTFLSSSDQAKAAAKAFADHWHAEIKQELADGAIDQDTADLMDRATDQIADNMGNKAGRDFANAMKQGLSGLGDVIIGAFQQGGGANRIGSSIGGSIGNTLGKAGGEAIGDALGSGIGSVLGSFLPGIGTLLGGMLGGVIGGLFQGSSGRDAITQFASSFGGFDRLHAKLDELGDAGEKMWQQIGSVGQDDAKGAQQLIQQISDAFGAQAKQIQADAIAANKAAAQLRMQGLTDASGGLAQALGVTGDAYKKLGEDQAALATASTQDQIDALNRDLIVQQGIIATTGLKSQAAAQGVADSLVAIVAANVQAGSSFVDAVRAQMPAIQALKAQLDATGYSGGAAFGRLEALANLATDAIAGPALTAVEGYTKTIKGLSEAGLLSQGTFAGLAEQIGTTAKTLLAQGFDSDTVMAAMQGDLQTVWEMEQKYGFKVDDTTQALIDQGVQSGILGEKHKSATDQMIDGLSAIDKDLRSLIDLFTGPNGIDKAAIKAATTIQSSFNGITVPDLGKELNIPTVPTRGGADDGGTQPNLGFPTGTHGIMDFGSGMTVRLHGREAVIPERDFADAGGRGDSGAMEWHLHLHTNELTAPDYRRMLRDPRFINEQALAMREITDARAKMRASLGVTS